MVDTDDFEKIVDNVKQEGLEASIGLSRLLHDMWKSAHDDMKAATAEARRFRSATIVLSILALASFFFCGFLSGDSIRQAEEIQALRGEVDAIHRILEDGIIIEETTTTEEVTTTTSQTVEGDTATINNGQWEQYNDNSANGGGE